MEKDNSKILFKKEFSQGNFIVYNSKPKNVNHHLINQVHGAKIVRIENIKENCKADGIVSSFQESICIKTADCLPILYLGKDKYSLVHAGWKGLVNKIHISNMLNEEVKPKEIFIGPSICKSCFEVKENFYQYFKEEKYYSKVDKKIYFDLMQYTIDTLKNKFKDSNIINNLQEQICTYHMERFNSFRRDGTDKRNYNTFIPN